MSDQLIEVRISEVVRETSDVSTYVLTASTSLPRFEAGAHIDVKLPNGMTRQYSLAQDPSATSHYRISVLREAKGRGGSLWMHRNLRSGDSLSISPPRNNFALADDDSPAILIAGGIGVTPILAMAYQLWSERRRFRFHYCTRTSSATPFRALLEQAPFSANLSLHHDEGIVGKGLDVRDALRGLEEGTHVYCCGPLGLIEAVKSAAADMSIADVHFEQFSAAPATGAKRNPFKIRIASSGMVLDVDAAHTILDVLLDHGFPISTSCEEGLCGTCLTGVLDGVPDHRDVVLSTQERERGNRIAVCCSRSLSPVLTLDL